MVQIIEIPVGDMCQNDISTLKKFCKSFGFMVVAKIYFLGQKMAKNSDFSSAKYAIFCILGKKMAKNRVF